MCQQPRITQTFVLNRQAVTAPLQQAIQGLLTSTLTHTATHFNTDVTRMAAEEAGMALLVKADWLTRCRVLNC